MNEKTKLVCVDFTNTLYIVLFSSQLIGKLNGLEFDTLCPEEEDDLFKDAYKMVIQKMFNILSYNQGYKTDILYCKDGKELWRRKEIFDEYKRSRKKTRDESPIDFKIVYKIFDRIWDEMKTALPFRFVQMNDIEVDDVIYRAIIKEYENYDKFQIMSTDQDFYQLLKYDKVEVYNPSTKKLIKLDDPEYSLFEKILTGDKSDWIPNILSETRDTRQPPMYKKNIAKWYADKKLFLEWLQTHPNSKTIIKNYKRNVALIDFRQIPKSKFPLMDTELEKPRTEFNLHKLAVTAELYNMGFIIDKIHLFEQNAT